MFCEDTKGVLNSSRLTTLKSPGYGLCLFLSFLDSKVSPKRFFGNHFSETTEAMRKMSKCKQLHLLSQTSRDIVRTWTKDLLKVLSTGHNTCPDKSKWNIELLCFYIAIFDQKCELLLYRQFGEYAYLVNCPRFLHPSRLPAEITSVFILQRERHGHFKAISALDAMHEVIAKLLYR